MSDVQVQTEEILVARKEIEDSEYTKIVKKDIILKAIEANNPLFQRSDNETAYLIGIFDVNRYVTFYAPTEDFTEEELSTIR